MYLKSSKFTGMIKPDKAELFWANHKELEQKLRSDLDLGNVDFRKFKSEILRISAENNINAKFTLEAFMEKTPLEMLALNEQLGPYIEIINKLDLKHLDNADHFEALTLALVGVCLIIQEPTWLQTHVNTLGETYTQCLDSGACMTQLSDSLAANIGVHNYGVLVDIRLAAKYGSNLAVTYCVTPKILIISGSLVLLPFMHRLLEAGGDFNYQLLKQTTAKLKLLRDGPTWSMINNISWRPSTSLVLGAVLGGGVLTSAYFIAGKTRTLALLHVPSADIYKGIGPIAKQNLMKLEKFGYIAGLAISLPLTAFRRAMAAPIIQDVTKYGKELIEYFSKKKK